MTTDEIRLLIQEKTEELIDKRSSTSFWRSVFITILILPLVYFGVSALAEQAAQNAASKALADQQSAWAAVYSQITKDAVESANRAEAANQSATSASSRATKSAKTLESAAANISETLGFQDRNEVVSAIVASADIQSVIASASHVRVRSCLTIDGPCGDGMFNQPTYYFDRVKFSCPEERPILRGIKFERCGNKGTSDEGLLLVATCCALSLGEEQ